MVTQNLYKNFFLCLTIAALSSNLCAHKTDTPLGTSAVPYGFLVRDNFKKAYQHLDEINAIMQYLAQTFSKGTVKISDKQQALDWILDQQTLIKNLNHSDETSPNDLNKVLLTTRSLAVHLSAIIANNFQAWTPFEPPVLRSPPVDAQQAEEYDFDSLIADNAQEIRILKEQANSAGLTTINKIARRLDDLNNRYMITDILERAALPLTFAAGFAISAIPHEWFAADGGKPVLKTAGLRFFKNIIGPAQKAAPPEDNQNRAAQAGTAAPQSWTISDFLSSNAIKSAKNAFLIFGAVQTGEVLQKYFGLRTPSIKPTLRNYWNTLKGLQVADQARYKYPDITLDSPLLIGLESQIEQMRNIIRYISDPESYDRSNCNLEKGILLAGGSRLGKSELAKAVCGSLNQIQREKGDSQKFKYFEISLEQIKWSLEGIKSVIDNYSAQAPCVLFIDEIHNLALQVKDTSPTDCLTYFLTMTEKLIGKSVIILAATNRPYLLDDALLKPGRFGLIIHFEPPLFENRKKFFEVYFKESALNSNDFDIDSLARQTEGASYGDLVSLFKGARFAARQQSRGVKQEDFQDCIYRQLYRIQLDRPVTLTPDERALISVHRAGHALMHMLHESQAQERFECVTIRGKWRKIVETRHYEAAARAAHTQKKTTYGHTISTQKSEALKLETNPVIAAKIKLAGHCAERLLLGSSTYSYHQKDRRKALNYCEKIAFEGLSKQDYTKDEQKIRMQKALTDMHRYEKEVFEELKKHEATLKAVALELSDKELLTAQDIKTIMAAHADGTKKLNPQPALPKPLAA